MSEKKYSRLIAIAFQTPIVVRESDGAILLKTGSDETAENALRAINEAFDAGYAKGKRDTENHSGVEW